MARVKKSSNSRQHQQNFLAFDLKLKTRFCNPNINDLTSNYRYGIAAIFNTQIQESRQGNTLE